MRVDTMRARLLKLEVTFSSTLAILEMVGGDDKGKRITLALPASAAQGLVYSVGQEVDVLVLPTQQKVATTDRAALSIVTDPPEVA